MMHHSDVFNRSTSWEREDIVTRDDSDSDETHFSPDQSQEHEEKLRLLSDTDEDNDQVGVKRSPAVQGACRSPHSPCSQSQEWIAAQVTHSDDLLEQDTFAARDSYRIETQDYSREWTDTPRMYFSEDLLAQYAAVPAEEYTSPDTCRIVTQDQNLGWSETQEPSHNLLNQDVVVPGEEYAAPDTCRIDTQDQNLGWTDETQTPSFNPLDQDVVVPGTEYAAPDTCRIDTQDQHVGWTETQTPSLNLLDQDAAVPDAFLVQEPNVENFYPEMIRCSEIKPIDQFSEALPDMDEDATVQQPVEADKAVYVQLGNSIDWDDQQVYKIPMDVEEFLLSQPETWLPRALSQISPPTVNRTHSEEREVTQEYEQLVPESEGTIIPESSPLWGCGQDDFRIDDIINSLQGINFLGPSAADAVLTELSNSTDDLGTAAYLTSSPETHVAARGRGRGKSLSMHGSPRHPRSTSTGRSRSRQATRSKRSHSGANEKPERCTSTKIESPTSPQKKTRRVNNLTSASRANRQLFEDDRPAYARLQELRFLMQDILRGRASAPTASEAEAMRQEVLNIIGILAKKRELSGCRGPKVISRREQAMQAAEKLIHQLQTLLLDAESYASIPMQELTESQNTDEICASTSHCQDETYARCFNTTVQTHRPPKTPQLPKNRKQKVSDRPSQNIRNNESQAVQSKTIDSTDETALPDTESTECTGGVEGGSTNSTHFSPEEEQPGHTDITEHGTCTASHVLMPSGPETQEPAVTAVSSEETSESLLHPKRRMDQTARRHIYVEKRAASVASEYSDHRVSHGTCNSSHNAKSTLTEISSKGLHTHDESESQDILTTPNVKGLSNRVSEHNIPCTAVQNDNNEFSDKPGTNHHSASRGQRLSNCKLTTPIDFGLSCNHRKSPDIVHNGLKSIALISKPEEFVWQGGYLTLTGILLPKQSEFFPVSDLPQDFWDNPNASIPNNWISELDWED